MLEGYEKLRDGIIKQVDATPPVYDEEYIGKYYLANGTFQEELSCLRLGLILGQLNHPINKILDVGYGNGGFLSRAAKIVEGCYGYDIGPAYPLPAKIKLVHSVTNAYYDLVTFFNSLEHIPDIDFVKNLQCQHVAITVPWCHYFSDDWFKDWKHRKPNEHIWHFNDESLTRFMSSQGYGVLHTSNAEDCLRGEPLGYPNYLTAIFKKN
jgi:hypothetical protein